MVFDDPLEFIGQIFNDCEVLEYIGKKYSVQHWRCKCLKCGRIAERSYARLIKHKCRNCVGITHGACAGGVKTPEFCIWNMMKQRCYNPNTKSYADYGGRGIRVCEKWRRSYAAFIGDMGQRPSSRHTLERLDNDKDYEPGNVVWATRATQGRNKRTNVLIEYNGETRCLAEWSEIFVIPYRLLQWRITTAKWPIEKAFTKPINHPCTSPHFKKPSKG